jgi:hypothetical protein
VETGGGSVSGSGMYTAPGTAGTFHVMATSVADTTKSAKATITVTAPTVRNISGSCIDNNWTASGKTQIPEDLTGSTFAALIPQPDGTMQVIGPVPGTSTGTFTIPGVPTGYYWLALNYSGTYNASQTAFWTSSSTFDCGTDFAGRLSMYEPQVDASEMDWSVTNLTPWLGLNPGDVTFDSVYAYSPNSNSTFGPWFGPGADGVTYVTEADTPDYFMNPVDTTQGDVLYLGQYSTVAPANGPSVQSTIASATAASPFTVVNKGDTGSVTGTMVPATANQTMEAIIDFAAYTQAENATSFIATNYDGYVLAQSFVNDRWSQNFNGEVSLAYFQNSGTAVPASVTDLGLVSYANQFPSTWPVTYDLQLWGSGTQPQIGLGIGHVSTTMPTVSSPDEPVMGMIQNPTINGDSFYSPSTAGYSGALTLSWSAPTGLPATGYYVFLLDPATGDTISEFATTQTSMTFPSQALPTGSYVIEIEAYSDSLANLQNAPFHYGTTEAWADSLSGVVVYTGTALTNAFSFLVHNDSIQAKAEVQTSVKGQVNAKVKMNSRSVAQHAPRHTPLFRKALQRVVNTKVSKS